MSEHSSDPLTPLFQRWLRSDDPDSTLAELCREHPEHEAALRARCAPDEDPAAPKQIGPYCILDTLGEGGMGTVYLAEQVTPVRRLVALKLIKLGMDSKEVVRRFEQERQALSVMDHEGIAKVFDVGTSERGQPYFVMELVQGVPIDAFCEKQRLSLEARLQLMRQVCAAIQHAHQKGVIHRDLKPGNVLVSEVDGRLRIKVIDFGLAKAVGQQLSQASMLTELGAVVGTPEFMAPEQADPRNPDVDTRADVYSLGVMLYQLLVGQLPFSSEDLREAGVAGMQRMLSEVEPLKPSTMLASTGERALDFAVQLGVSVSGLRKALKGDLDWLVVKALEKERGRRYQSASALGDDLQRYLDHEPLEAGPPSIGYRLQKLLRRNRGKFLAAGLLLLTMVGGAVATYVQWQRAEDQARDNLALAESERAAKDEERVAKEEALRATRLANLRSVQLAARQGQQARVLELVDPLIETAADNDELVDLLLLKVEAQVNSGKRPFQETYRQLLELDASKAESPRVKVAVAYQRALVGANAAKTKRAFTELLAAGGLTPAQEALCRALSTESVQDAIRGLRAALELGSYDPGAAGMLSVLAGMTADKDLLLELRATERAARAGYTGLTSADVWLAVTADEPLAGGVLENDPRLRELAVAVYEAKAELPGLWVQQLCAYEHDRRVEAQRACTRTLQKAFSSSQRVVMGMGQRAGVTYGGGLGIPALANLTKQMLRNTPLLRGSVSDQFEAATRWVEQNPTQAAFVQRSLAHEQLYDQSGDLSHLVAAFEDAKAGLEVPWVLFSRGIILKVLRAQYASRILLHRGLDEVARADWLARLPGLLEAVVQEPAAGPDGVGWAARRALEAGLPRLARSYADRWVLLQPDAGIAHFTAGQAGYALGSYAGAYQAAERAVALAVDADHRQAAEQLRQRAWEKVGWIGSPDAAQPKQQRR